MSSEYNVQGKPLRINELDIMGMVQWLHDNKIRNTQGKIIQPLFKSQEEIILDPARFKVVAAGRRFSKTTIAFLISLVAFMQPNRNILIVSVDYGLTERVFKELYNIIVNQLKLVQPGKIGRARFQKGDYLIESEWGSTIEAKSMERPDSLVGLAADLVVIDEAALQSNIEDIWIQLIQPCLLDKQGAAFFISTPRGKNTFYKLFLMGQLGLKQRLNPSIIKYDEEKKVNNDMRDWVSFRKTSYDNPLLSISPEKSKEEIDNAYRRAVLSGKIVKFKQEYLADFEAVTEACFSEFKEGPTSEHPYPNIVDYDWHPDEGLIFSSSDHNYARNASTIFAQVNKYNDVVIFDEKFTPHTTSYMQAQQILDEENYLNKKANKIWTEQKISISDRYRIIFEEIIADVSGSQRQLSGRSAWDDFYDILGRKPVGLKQSREVGCDMIRHWFQFPDFDEKGRPIIKDSGEQKTVPKLFISSNCTNLIYALSTAKFKKTKAGAFKTDYEETPEGYEGLLDALRYLMVYLFHDTNQHFSLVGGF